MKLYIIGNGFDLHHGLKTKFFDYKKFLDKTDFFEKYVKHSYFETEFFMPAFDYSAKADWSDIEADLSIEYQDYMSDVIAKVPYERQEEDRMPDYHGKAVTIEDELEFLRHLTGDYLVKWLNECEISDQKMLVKRKDIDPNALFVTFNYTHTLEKLYNIKGTNILHIHGSIQDSSHIVFGTPKNNPTDVANKLEKLYAESDDDVEISVRFGIQALSDACGYASKVFATQYDALNNFLDNAAEAITEVVVMGHNFNGIDKPYYDEIFTKKLCSATWTFLCHKRVATIKDFKKQHPEIQKVFAQKWDSDIREEVLLS